MSKFSESRLSESDRNRLRDLLRPDGRNVDRWCHTARLLMPILVKDQSLLYELIKAQAISLASLASNIHSMEAPFAAIVRLLHDIGLEFWWTDEGRGGGRIPLPSVIDDTADESAA